MRLDLKAKHQVYRGKHGEYPGVTSMLNVFAKQALMPWYAAMEREGIVHALEPFLGKPLPVNFSDVLPRTKEGKPKWFANLHRDTAADLGKVAHAHVEAHFKGESLDRDGLDPKMYEQSFEIAQRYLLRLSDERFVCVHSEYELIDDDLRVGGTGDRFGMIGSEWVYRDLKTSKPWAEGKPYNETVAQSCGYTMMFEKQTGEQVKRIFIDRIGKVATDPGSYWELTTKQRAVGERWFKLGVQAYYCNRDMEDVLR